MDRRGFLGSIFAACIAPAIVRADSLMKIVPRETTLIVPWRMETKEVILNENWLKQDYGQSYVITGGPLPDELIRKICRGDIEHLERKLGRKVTGVVYNQLPSGVPNKADPFGQLGWVTWKVRA